MSINWPKLEWQDFEGDGSKALTDDFSLATRLREGGPDAGTWSAIMNGSSLTSGGGQYGYNFDSMQQAKDALEVAMMDTIKARIEYAKKVLKKYT